MTKKIIRTDKAPKPVGPYNQAVVSDNLIFTAGQISIDPRTNEVVHDGDVEAQTRRVLNNLSAVLKAAGSRIENVVKTTIFLKNMGDFGKVNSVYGEFFSENSPARSTVEVSCLPKNVLVEIDCIATIEGG